MKIVNGSLLANPLNWLIVWLMLIVAAMAGHLLLDAAGVICPHNAEQTE